MTSSLVNYLHIKS